MQQRTSFRLTVLTFLGAVALTPMAAFLAVSSPTPVQAAPTVYTAFLSGPAAATPNNSPGIGSTQVELDTVANTLRVKAQFSGLVGNVTAAHIHAPTAVAGAGAAGVATEVPFFAGFPIGGTSGTYDNTFDTTDPQTWNPSYITANGGTPAGAEAALDAALAAGKAYLNVHSSVFGSGEIRGFLTPPTPFPNGDFEAGATDWTLGSINGGIARVEIEGSCFGANSTLGITMNGRRALNVRSRADATTDSIGVATSSSFIAGNALKFSALAENDDAIPAENPVTLLVQFLSDDNVILAVQGVTPVLPSILTTSPGTSNDGCLVGDVRDGSFSEHVVDTTAIAGQSVRVEFWQHTNVPGKGFFTLIDDLAILE